MQGREIIKAEKEWKQYGNDRSSKAKEQLENETGLSQKLKILWDQHKSTEFAKLIVKSSRISHYMIRYSINAEQADIFDRLITQMKKDLYDKKSMANSIRLIEVADEITTKRLISTGSKAGLTEEQVRMILPAMAVKLTASEVKNLLTGFKSGFFASAQEFGSALHNVEEKYTKRFDL